MSLEELYREIASRKPMSRYEVHGLGGKEDWHPGALGKRARIAAILPSGELDIMKVARSGYAMILDAPRSTLDYGHKTDADSIRSYEPRLNGGRSFIAVATVCLGQASMRLRSDGTVHLNDLVATGDITPTGDYLKGDPFQVDFPGCTLEDINEELGPLRGYGKAHWVYLEAQPIVRVSKGEMRQIQSALR